MEKNVVTRRPEMRGKELRSATEVMMQRCRMLSRITRERAATAAMSSIDSTALRMAAPPNIMETKAQWQTSMSFERQSPKDSHAPNGKNTATPTWKNNARQKNALSKSQGTEGKARIQISAAMMMPTVVASNAAYLNFLRCRSSAERVASGAARSSTGSGAVSTSIAAGAEPSPSASLLETVLATSPTTFSAGIASRSFEFSAVGLADGDFDGDMDHKMSNPAE
mmetsp:Transcript_55343/g.121436  ORF Transcript_55343/g.121436 Transcript_55343/m.121436 type:complete len:224 (+) Transcript_55343:206-877(+)